MVVSQPLAWGLAHHSHSINVSSINVYSMWLSSCAGNVFILLPEYPENTMVPVIAFGSECKLLEQWMVSDPDCPLETPGKTLENAEGPVLKSKSPRNGGEPRHGWETVLEDRDPIYRDLYARCCEIMTLSCCCPSGQASNPNQVILFSVPVAFFGHIRCCHQPVSFWEPIKLILQAPFSVVVPRGGFSFSIASNRAPNPLQINMKSKLRECVLLSRLSNLSFQQYSHA